MVQINFATREVNCKIVYYGPGRCGKTTNLQAVHAKAPANSTGELVSIATETDRTLYFDFLPLDLGTVAGMRTKFSLYTVPGQIYYDATRKLVLQGADGVVFVADSNPEMANENLESLNNLEANLKENGLDINDLPLVLQWNKRDLPNAMPVAEMNAKLNRNDWPVVEAAAVNGEGVFKTLKVISQLVIRKLNREQGYAEDGTKKPAAAMARPAPPPPPAGRPAAPPPPPPPPPPPKAASTLPAPPPPPKPVAQAAPPSSKPVPQVAPPPPRPVAAPQPVLSVSDLGAGEPVAAAAAGGEEEFRPAAAAGRPSVFAQKGEGGAGSGVRGGSATAPPRSPTGSGLNPVSAEIARRKMAQQQSGAQGPASTVVTQVRAAPAAGRSTGLIVVVGLLLVAVIVAALWHFLK